MSLVEVYWRTLTYLAAARGKVAVICGSNVLLAIVAIAEPILFGRIIDAISEKSDVTPTLAAWAGLGVFNIIAFVLVSRGADRLAHKVRGDVLSRSYENMITMPLSWHSKRGTSYSLHTLLRGVEAMFSLWLEFMRQHLSTAVALVLLVPTAIALDLRMSMVLLALGVSYVTINRIVMKRTKDGQAAVEQHYHKVFAHVSDSVSNVSVLQSYGRVQQETQALKEHVQRLINAQYPVLDWWAIASALQRLSSTISMMVVLIIGAILVSRGELRIGDVVAFTGFATLLISRLDQITGFVNQVFEARAKLEAFYEVEDAVQERSETYGAKELGNVEGRIVFDNVNFRFPGTSEGVSDISFSVEAGQTVAIVGPTGAGKTTLINLLQRVFDPYSGTITIDGIDTRSVLRGSLRRQMATVFQDAGLLNRSIEHNIRLGREDALNDDVHHAARAAAAEGFILGKSEGYDTVVGERGGQLSGGERQRIAIARAILKDAPILVLDEATSALDVETEEQVKEAIDRLRENRTTFVIAHRLSTVRDADLVIFMDSGRIVEMGGFDELARRNGRFASLLRAGGLLNDEEVRRSIRLAPAIEAA
ncbi:glucan ABC transporter ATP-binding protein/ permease [Aliihoeflea aestuarii]|uniref:glucan ABC transporter ATP-binding protein/ permease n=1 Tax=Aliihoeflea aestuarii TaxID=453840 RepID=UPI0020939440|nr:glucan ABC transporter ATP-binding protein/ permease [Aliihoeflea aestuarii]MCO6390188.1 glucan ABC transporter ATP-binding protein/ permease [Aliihoeflea aestuarii]